MVFAVLSENCDFPKLKRFNYKSVSEFNVRNVFKPNAKVVSDGNSEVISLSDLVLPFAIRYS